MQLRTCWLLLLFGACGVYGADTDPPNAETRLQEKLRKISRAVGRQYLRRPGTPGFTINGTMTGMQLEKVDEGTSLLEMSLQFKYAYFHPNLTWDPAAFEGITQTSLTFDELSAPRVAGCYAAAYTAVPDGVFEIFVYSDGYVEIASDAAVKNKCLLDLSRIPYDHHACYACVMVVGLTNDASFFNMSLPESFSVANTSEWTVSAVRTKMEREQRGRLRIDQTYLDFEITRNPTTYQYGLITLAMLISNLTIVVEMFLGDHSGALWGMLSGTVFTTGILWSSTSRQDKLSAMYFLSITQCGVAVLHTLYMIGCKLIRDVYSSIEEEEKMDAEKKKKEIETIKERARQREKTRLQRELIRCMEETRDSTRAVLTVIEELPKMLARQERLKTIKEDADENATNDRTESERIPKLARDFSVDYEDDNVESVGAELQEDTATTADEETDKQTGRNREDVKADSPTNTNKDETNRGANEMKNGAEVGAPDTNGVRRRFSRTVHISMHDSQESKGSQEKHDAVEQTGAANEPDNKDKDKDEGGDGVLKKKDAESDKGAKRERTVFNPPRRRHGILRWWDTVTRWHIAWRLGSLVFLAIAWVLYWYAFQPSAPETQLPTDNNSTESNSTVLSDMVENITKLLNTA